jgi:signal transduction histidine kinase
LLPEWVELLYEVGRQFSSSLELDVVMGKVLDLTVKCVSATAGSIFLLDPDGQPQTNILIRRDLPPEVRRATVSTVMTRGFAGWVYRQRRAAIIANTQTDTRWYIFPGDQRVSVARSAMAAPFIRRDNVIGIITLVHNEPNRFTKRQLELLEAIAGQAASAVENAALYTRVNRERSMLQAVFAGVQDIIVVSDMHDRILLANPAARRLLALTADAAGQSFEAIIHEPELTAFYRAARSQTHALREVSFSDGRVFDCALVQIPNVGRVLGMHDVTAFKRLDALKNEFVAHVSHDLKAPLTIVHGYAELLADATLPPAEHTYAQNIMASVKRMQGLIDDLLDLNQIEQGLESEFETLDLGVVARGALEQLRALADDKRIALTVSVALNLPYVQGASVRLGQAVTNLLSNALKFTPEGGAVTVAVLHDNGEVIVRVADTGPGIPSGLKAKLFQKFSRLGQNRDSEGHGLGLSIVKSVMDAHHGRVWVESPPDGGSVFAFALPAIS